MRKKSTHSRAQSIRFGMTSAASKRRKWKSRNARKPVAAMPVEHQQLRHVAFAVTAAIRQCHAQSFFSHASRLRLMMAEHCIKEEGIVFRMADHFLGPAAHFLIDSMRAMQMRKCNHHPHAALANVT